MYAYLLHWFGQKLCKVSACTMIKDKDYNQSGLLAVTEF